MSAPLPGRARPLPEPPTDEAPKGGSARGLALTAGEKTGIVLCTVVLLALLAPLQAASEPYASLRDAELRYHGPSEDLENLAELLIGWFGPSDPDDPLNGDLWWAANLALAEANEHAGVAPDAPFASLPFRMIPRWSTDPWGTGVSQLTRMVYDEEPLALLGSVDSAATHLAEQVVAKAQLPLVSPIATDPTITLAGVSWVFSCAPSDHAIARALVDAILGTPAGDPSGHAGRDVRPLSLVVLSTTDHESRMTARALLRELSRRGRLPDLHREIKPGTTDATPHLESATTPDTMVIIAGVEDAARITRATRAKLGAVAIYGGPAMSRNRFIELAGLDAEGIVVPALFASDVAGTATSEFVARFTAARGHAPDYTAALTYDATRLLTTAIRRAGPNRARIRTALAELSPWTGVAGTLTFDGTGQNRTSTVPLGQIRDSRVVVSLAAP